MRFIHAADIHLDSPLTGLSAYADAPAEHLRTATRQAFANLVSKAIEEKVDFLIIAGDLYDGSWKDHNTGIYFCKEMGRLRKANIAVYVLFGNHDAESEMTTKLQLPDNVFAFEPRRVTTYTLDHLKVALHGRSYKEPATTDNLVLGYPPPLPGVLNIGVLHTALEGYSAHSRYAPCSLEELHAKGYHYWALGHVHEHKIWRGRSTIVFPGSLQGRHIGETGTHGAVLVTADESGIQDVDRIFVDVVRWQNLDLNVAACNSFADVVRVVGAALEVAAESTPSHVTSAVRVHLTGRTPAHGELFGLEAQLRAEVIGLIATIGSERLWLERIEVATLAPDDGAALRSRADALSDLQTLLDTAESDPVFMKVLQDELMPLVSKTPSQIQTLVPYFNDIRSGDLSKLIQEVRNGLVAHLSTLE